MDNSLKRILLDNLKNKICKYSQTLGTKFQVKDKTIDQHKHDLVYYSKCPEPTFNDNYLGETRRRTIERSADHCSKDKQSHLLTHVLNSNYKAVDLKGFKIIDFSYNSNKCKRKISEALYINQYTPS